MSENKADQASSVTVQAIGPTPRCLRCRERRETVAPVTLVGEYEAVLCLDCKNAWTEYVWQSDLWADIIESDARKDYFKHSEATSDAWEQWYMDRHGITLQLHQMAKVWVLMGPSRDKTK